METWLNENLRVLAEARGLLHGDKINQTAVEKATKVAQTTISGIIKQGKIPRLDTLTKLAKGLGVETWQLLAPPAVLRASLRDSFPELIEILSRQ